MSYYYLIEEAIQNGKGQENFVRKFITIYRERESYILDLTKLKFPYSKKNYPLLLVKIMVIIKKGRRNF